MSIIAIRRDLTAGAVFFRQRGQNVEYSLDNSQWYHAWRMTAGASSSSTFTATEYNTNIDAAVTVLNAYNGTTVTIAPNLVFDTTPADINRGRVMCAAMELYVKLARQTITGYVPGWLDNSEQNMTDGVNGLLVMGAGLIFEPSPFTEIVTIPAGVAGLLSILVGGFKEGVKALFYGGDLSHWNNDAAVENVICYTANYMSEATPTIARFIEAFDPDAAHTMTPEGTAERKILEDLERIAPTQYLPWVALADLSYSTTAGNLYECPCNDLWRHVIDFKQPFVPAYVSLGTGVTHRPGQGLYRATGANSIYFNVNPGALFNITSFGMRYSYNVTGGATSPHLRMQSQGGVGLWTIESSEPLGSNLLWTARIDPAKSTANLVLIRTTYGTLGSPWMYVHNLTIQGIGTNPFI